MRDQVRELVHIVLLVSALALSFVAAYIFAREAKPGDMLNLRWCSRMMLMATPCPLDKNLNELSASFSGYWHSSGIRDARASCCRE